MTDDAKKTKQGLGWRIKSSVLNWLGLPITLTDTGFWAAWFGVSSTGKSVTQETLLKLSTAWACGKLLAETCGGLPAGVFYKGRSGESVEDPKHPIHVLVSLQPQFGMSAVTFWTCVFLSIEFWGNAFIEKVYQNGRIISLNFLLPSRVNWKTSRDGSRTYTIYDANGGSPRTDVSENRVWHIPGFSTDGKVGLSTIQYGANVFGAAVAAEEAGASVFKNGLQSGGFFEVEKLLSPKQREQFKKELEEFQGSSNAGKTMVLEANMKFNKIGINPDDAQLLETRKFSIDDICRWFGVPGFMVNHSSAGDTNWGTGVEQRVIGFVRFSVLPRIIRVEQSARLNLFTPEERARYYLKFDLKGLMRGDSKARAEYYRFALQDGWMNRATVAGLEDIAPPTVGGELYTIQANLTALALMDKKVRDGMSVGEVQGSALNGIQITALLGILKDVINGQIPVEAAAAVIAVSFPTLQEDQISAMLEELEGFEPEPPPTAPTSGTPGDPPAEEEEEEEEEDPENPDDSDEENPSET